MSSSSKAFQPEHATVLYEKGVRVRVQRSDREDCTEVLQVRLALDHAPHTSSASDTGLLGRQDGSVGGQLLAGRVLRLQLTSEDDPYFLHTMEVGEEDFQTLKADQAILVDFGAFPQEVIKLLDACASAEAEESPTFKALLRLEAGFSTFSLLEVNKFKHLSHLVLRCRPGNDVAVKRYLACRLWDVKAERASLQGALSATQSTLAESQALAETQAAQIAEQRETSASLAGNLRNEQAAQLNKAKQQALAELDEATRRFEAEKAKMEKERRDAVGGLEKRNAELDAQARTLMEQKYGLDAKVSELSAKLGTATGELEVVREELKRLRGGNAQLDSQMHEAEKANSAHLIKISGLEQSVKDKDELLATLRTRLESVEAHKDALEHSVRDARASAAKSEERVAAVSAEILKGNSIIEKLQSELKTVKAKAKLKTTVITQQESLIQEKQATMDKLSREMAGAQLEANGLREEKQALQARVADQTAKLEESTQLLQSNQQMIQWLNQQVNEAQLGKIGTSRYSFRPSSLTQPVKASVAAPPVSIAPVAY